VDGKAAFASQRNSTPRFRVKFRNTSRIRLPSSFSEGVEESGFIELPIQFTHVAAAELLPNHHADPFDRMIVAQSKVEKLVVVSHDRGIEPYGIPVIWT
jgi:PIN domain nuclease of toxin-antitoxin system